MEVDLRKCPYAGRCVVRQDGSEVQERHLPEGELMRTRTKIAIAGALLLGTVGTVEIANRLGRAEESKVGVTDGAGNVGDASTPSRRIPPRRVLATLPVPANEVTPVRYRAMPHFGDEMEDFRRNFWEELQGYGDEAKLTDEQRGRLFDDLADLAEALRAEMDRDLEARAPWRSADAIWAEHAELLMARMQYLSDAQWDLFVRRFKSYRRLPMEILGLQLFERDTAVATR